ncbi:unnamed protein product [Callosobruchus maculatus]|uniref:Uncharacterized protein n=1 Tax=Callosobruchus maculatus TaxID=64391 RepID=A0A653DY99_CALMS|nr:unnamed protein product [Callosobruchus maculatus]
MLDVSNRHFLKNSSKIYSNTLWRSTKGHSV